MRQLYVKFSGILLVLVASISMLQGQEPTITAEANPSDPTGFAVVKFKLTKGDDVQWEVSPKPSQKKVYVDGDYSYLIFNGPADKTYTVTADFINWDAKKRGRPTLDVVIGKAPQPPPVPPGPNPPGPTPKPPEPAKTFRVIFVYESADNLSPSERGVVYGKVTEDWLNANCTGGKNGWRRRDKNAPGEADATFSALWEAVKPAITVTPCVAIEKNGDVTIINLESSPTKMVEVLNQYKGGTK